MFVKVPGGTNVDDMIFSRLKKFVVPKNAMEGCGDDWLRAMGGVLQNHVGRFW